ncbi:MAG: hypothetical protein M1827_003073 [Pycnora praestabilis]|nr:MAG: hypothetical protein M1827_003073 [Pycnora praestabilis]
MIRDTTNTNGLPYTEKVAQHVSTPMPRANWTLGESGLGGQIGTVLGHVVDLHLSSKKWNYDRVQSRTMPHPSEERRLQSLRETPFELETLLNGSSSSAITSRSTVLYLAYGSNLSAETFQGRRGIKPLAQVNVVVPQLKMTFDLPGIPYLEPCFANTRYLHETPALSITSSNAEKAPLLSNPGSPGYHKDQWKKGLVGVVYEVTMEDYAHIIETEGGGAAYQDVLINCYPLPPGIDTVPEYPDSKPFFAHTLYAPTLPSTPPGQPPPKTGGRFERPDPSYAQPSARYLKLITDGANEHGFPQEYKDYLFNLRPYTITQAKQRMGLFIFATFWLPMITFIFRTAPQLFPNQNGRSPAWLVELSGAVFRGAWASYDEFFRKLFGDGERTDYDHPDEDEQRQEGFGTINWRRARGQKDTSEVV